MTGIERHTQRLMGMMVVLGMALPGLAFGAVHSADISGNGRISLSELLRVIQFYNSETYSCAAESEDGYTPESGACDCTPHASDYIHQDWRIELSELLRLIQLYNMKRYATAPGGIEGSEDGFMPVSDEELAPYMLPVAGDTDGNYLTEAEEVALGIGEDLGSPPIGIRLADAVSARISELYSSEMTQDYDIYDCDRHPDSLPVARVFICWSDAECECYSPFDDSIWWPGSIEIRDPVTGATLSFSAIANTFLHKSSFTYLYGYNLHYEGEVQEYDYCYTEDSPVHRMDVVALVQMLGIDPNAI